MEPSLIIEPHPAGAPWPWELLERADPDRAIVAAYLPEAQLWRARQGMAVVGICACTPVDTHCLEIRNLAVAPAWEGQGIATRLIATATEAAHQAGYTRLRIATGNSSTRQLRLYQRLGFELCAVRWDFFTERYAAPIYEDGIHCRHLLVLEKALGHA